MSDRLDPRYDPRFQRGFTGPVPVAQVTGPVPVAQVPDARVPDVRAPDADPVPPDAAAPPTSATPVPLVDRPLTENPLIWGLLVAGVALIVAAIGLLTWWMALARASGTQQVDYALLMFLIQLTPVLIGLGGATLLGVGFLFAVDRQRRTRTPSEGAREPARWRR